LFTKYVFTLKISSVFKNFKNKSSTNQQIYCIKNKWPNFDKDVIAMDEEE
jgi:hypothetical protein